MRPREIRITAFAVLIIAGAPGNPVRGQIIRTPGGITGTSGGQLTGQWDFLVAPGSQVQTGDYIVFYDYYQGPGGPAPTVSAGWSASTANLTPPPPGVLFPFSPDDPNALNVIFRRTGPTIVNSGNAPLYTATATAVSSNSNYLTAADPRTAYQSHSNVAPASVPTTGQGSAVITFDPPVVTGTGPFTWTYNASLQPYVRLSGGNPITIYDFAGLNRNTVKVPPGWQATFALTTPPPNTSLALLLADNSDLYNVTFNWLGGNLDNTSLSNQPLALGAFVLESSSALAAPLLMTEQVAVGVTSIGGSGGSVTSQGLILGAAVPEPSALGLSALVAFIVSGVAVKRRLITS
jgi:hypothetical protein